MILDLEGENFLFCVKKHSVANVRSIPIGKNIFSKSKGNKYT